MDSPNPNGLLVCCTLCGRDTRSKAAVCARCGGGRTFSDERGRKGRNAKEMTHDPFREAPASETGRDYQGGSIRDDI
jgi:hypothetical protein